MLLAGGQGSRLKPLTARLAKPAVSFGGKYRIIDFTLSNCTNSDIDTIGILTQYQPLQLHEHIGNGSYWDLDRKNGGLHILSPFVGVKGGRWYEGTANAIYENIHFIDSYAPEYVLILSGDHIYKMNYGEMLEEHKKNKADSTLAVIEVPWKEVYRFGTMNIYENNKIYAFQEKNPNAKSNLASMGIYIFNWSTLRELLIEDEMDKFSHHDFGKDIIPKMIKGDLEVYAYKFKGYWRDVGTVESLWQANMDLLKEDNQLNLYDNEWKVYTKNPNIQPHYIGKEGIVKGSLLNEGCIVNGEVTNSVLFSGVHVGENAKVKDSVVLPNVIIADHSVIEKALIMENKVIQAGKRIGEENSKDITVV